MAATPVSPDDFVERFRLALLGGGLTLAYQPKIDLRTGAVSGVEALARWTDPELGSVSPAVFVAAAEQGGLIDLFTEWGLSTALRQWRSWFEAGFETQLSFNLSALSLGNLRLPDEIQRLCMLEGVPCRSLTLEVTESATQTAVRLLDTLTRFRLKGIGLALDDFGTGYSSLLQLRHLPYSELKIDQCFARDAAAEDDSMHICKAIIDLAHSLGLTATAEGIEDLETLALLRDLGCDEGQGFLISRPLDAQGFSQWLRAYRPLAEPGAETDPCLASASPEPARLVGALH